MSIGATYVVSVLLGAICVHNGVDFALRHRDWTVSRAVRQDPASIAYRDNRLLKAAALDFEHNLLLGAVPDTVAGLAIALPYPMAAYRGWVGGIVSVDGHHRSRLSAARVAIPFLLVVILQLVPYSLAGGMGIYLGFSYLSRGQAPKVLGLPRDALFDVLRVYSLIVPLFALASLLEFYLL